MKSRKSWPRLPELKPAERKLAAQLSGGSPGAAMELDLEAAEKLRRDDPRGPRTRLRTARRLRFVLARTTALAKSVRRWRLKNILEVFYSLLTDLLDLSCSPSVKVLRNPSLRKELETLSKKADLAWISTAVDGLDVLHSRLRRNINKSLGLDAVAISLAGQRR